MLIYFGLCAAFFVGWCARSLFEANTDPQQEPPVGSFGSMDIDESFYNLRDGVANAHDEQNLRDAAEFERGTRLSKSRTQRRLLWLELSINQEPSR